MRLRDVSVIVGTTQSAAADHRNVGGHTGYRRTAESRAHARLRSGREFVMKTLAGRNKPTRVPKLGIACSNVVATNRTVQCVDWPFKSGGRITLSSAAEGV